MNRCCALRVGEAAPQGPADHSYIGGIPKLPAGRKTPRCNLCNNEQSFLFQIAFPQGHFWDGFSIASFICTLCADERFLIPEMLQQGLFEANIPKGFLDDYQVNFSFLVFKNENLASHNSYKPRVRFKRLEFEPVEQDFEGSKIGGAPSWMLEDESPRSYAGVHPMFFLLQLRQEFQFDLYEDAPRQVELALDGTQKISSLAYYQIFNGNSVYLFGTENRTEPLVYAVTQI